MKSNHHRAVIEMYAQGHSLQATGQAFGTCATQVMKLLIRAGIPRRRHGFYAANPLNPDLGPRDREIVAMYRSGHSFAATGREFGVSRERARQVVATAGVPSRGHTSVIPRTNECRVFVHEETHAHERYDDCRNTHS